MSIQFGVCCPLALLPQVLEAGFDYGEAFLAGLLTDPPKEKPVGIQATNGFFPSSLLLHDPSTGDPIEYARKAIECAADLGAKVCVIGSGASRRAPPGVEVQEAQERFFDLAAEISSLATPYGITIAPEPLNESETNVATDQRILALELAKRGCSFTLDTYHASYKGNLDWETILPIVPAHVHLASVGRAMPRRDDAVMQGAARRLLELGYAGRVSLEYSSRNAAAEFHEALVELRGLFDS